MSDLIVSGLIASGFQAVIAVSGGGSSAVASLLRVPGASCFVLEASVPYHADALRAYVDAEPVSLCSSEVAGEMARVAFKRALRWAEDEGRCVGIACTAALQTGRERRGSDRAHFSVVLGGARYYRFVSLPAVSREEQEQYLGLELLAYVYACLELPDG
jgi:hypothetical protein|tara:strand:+ start:117 stop:593 length:477 start_codon:yes stop_codon:yes gene_type:complete